MGRGIYVIERSGEDESVGVFMASEGGSRVESSPRRGRSELFGESEAVSRREWFLAERSVEWV